MDYKDYAKSRGIDLTTPDPEFDLWQEFLEKFPIFKNRAYTEDMAQEVFKFFYSKHAQELQQAREEGKKEGYIEEAMACDRTCKQVRKDAIEEAIELVENTKKIHWFHADKAIEGIVAALHSLITPTN